MATATTAPARDKFGPGAKVKAKKCGCVGSVTVDAGSVVGVKVSMPCRAGHPELVDPGTVARFEPAELELFEPDADKPTVRFSDDLTGVAIRATAVRIVLAREDLHDVIPRSLGQAEQLVAREDVAEVLHEEATARGLVAVAKALEYTNQTREVTAVYDAIAELLTAPAVSGG